MDARPRGPSTRWHRRRARVIVSSRCSIASRTAAASDARTRTAEALAGTGTVAAVNGGMTGVAAAGVAVVADARSAAGTVLAENGVVLSAATGVVSSAVNAVVASAATGVLSAAVSSVASVQTVV